MDPVAALAARLAPAGFDVAHAFDARAIRDDARARFGAMAASRGELGVLVGNTRALWAPFVVAVTADPVLAASRDPLDAYTEAQLAAAAPGADIYYSHRAYDGRWIPFQALAVAVGLGTISRTHFVIHPLYGPWIALRAAIVLAAPAHAPAAQPAPPCACDGTGCEAAFARAQSTPMGDAWLAAQVAVRDACTVGRAHRYSDDQLAYHSTKDRRFLR